MDIDIPGIEWADEEVEPGKIPDRIPGIEWEDVERGSVVEEPTGTIDWGEVIEGTKLFGTAGFFQAPCLYNKIKSLTEKLPDPEEEMSKIQVSIAAAEEMGVSPAFIHRNFPLFAKEYTGKDVDAKTLWGYWKDKWIAGRVQATLGLLGFAQLAGDDSEETQDLIYKYYAMRPEPESIKRALPARMVGKMLELSPVWLEGARQGVYRAPAVGTAFGLTALMLGQAIPMIPPEEIFTVPGATAFGLQLGFASGAIESIGKIEAGSAWLELKEITGPNGEKIKPEVARAAAASIGMINMLIEMVQINTILKTIPGAKQLFRKGIIKAVAAAINSKQLTTMLLRHSARFTKELATEVSQEVAQETVNILFNELAIYINNETEGTEIAHQWNQALPRIEQVLVDSAEGFALMLLPGHIAEVSIGIAKGRQVRVYYRNKEIAKAIKEGLQDREKVTPEPGETVHLSRDKLSDELREEGVSPGEEIVQLDLKAEELERSKEDPTQFTYKPGIEKAPEKIEPTKPVEVKEEVVEAPIVEKEPVAKPTPKVYPAEVKKIAKGLKEEADQRYRDFKSWNIITRVRDLGKIYVRYFRKAEELQGLSPYVITRVFTQDKSSPDIDEMAASLGMSDIQLIQALTDYEHFKKPAAKVESYYEQAELAYMKERAERAFEKESVNEIDLEQGYVFTIDGEVFRVVEKNAQRTVIKDRKRYALEMLESINIDKGSLRKETKLLPAAKIIVLLPEEAGGPYHKIVLRKAPGPVIKAEEAAPAPERIIWELYEKFERWEDWKKRFEFEYDSYEKAAEELAKVTSKREQAEGAEHAEQVIEDMLPTAAEEYESVGKEKRPPGGEKPPRTPRGPGTIRRARYPEEAEYRELEIVWQKIKDIWIGNKDVRILKAMAEEENFRNEIKSFLKKKRRAAAEIVKMEAALELYIDTKRDPEAIDKYIDELSEKKKDIIALSQNLPEEMQKLSERMERSYQEVGLDAMEADIIRNVLEHYAARVWDMGGKNIVSIMRKFGTKTRHAKPRVFNTIIEGWANGFELRIESGLTNLRILKEEIYKTIEDKKLISVMRRTRDVDGNPLITSNSKMPNYSQIKNPNFKMWEFAGKVEFTYTIESMKQLNESSTVKYLEKTGEELQELQGTIESLKKVVKDALITRGFTENEAEISIRKLEDTRAPTEVRKIIETIERSMVEKEKIVSTKAVPVGGRDWFTTEDGTVMMFKPLYAPKKVAQDINNILGRGIEGIPVLKNILRFNTLTKSYILQTSFFHHLAFMRSYYFPFNHKKWGDQWVINAYREGYNAILNLEPEIVYLVRHGLTLGRKQDWSEYLIREQLFLGKIIDKIPGAKQVKDQILALRANQADWLFGVFGAGLKAKVALLLFRNELLRNPDVDPGVSASIVAGHVNDDFGGLHLERMGRNPILQVFLRLIFLAPDWTESNVRTMVKVFVGTKNERKIYHEFWVGALVKCGGAIALLNYLLAGGDLDEMEKNYKRAWKEGNMKWASVDITPIYRAFGGKTYRRKYLNLMGHFRDPFKFIIHPIRSLHHKGSVIERIIHEAYSGVDYAGRRFTTINELIKTGEFVTWEGAPHPIKWEQFPSYMIHQVVGMQPVQVQNLIGWMNGESEAFDAILNSLGLQVSTTYR